MLKILRHGPRKNTRRVRPFIFRSYSDDLSVYSTDNYGPLSYCAVAYKAGSQYEPYDKRGLSHYIRTAVELSSKGYQNIILMRSLQSSGAGLECISNRLYIMYIMYSTIDHFEKKARYFFDIASTIKTDWWEWALLDDRVKGDASSLMPKQRLMEMLHAVAFKGGLSGSIYCPDYNIGKISAENVCDYRAQFFTKARCVVVSSGLPTSRTTDLASLMNLEDGSTSQDKEVANVFKGGEWRKYEKLEMTHVAVAVEGCKATDKANLLCYAILAHSIARKAHIVGTQGTKLASGCGPMYKALSYVGERVHVESFNISYEDNGLFGLYGISKSEDCHCVLDKMVEFLRNGIIMEITDQDLEIGKAALAMLVAEADRTPRDWIENIVSQKLMSMELKQPMELAEEIQKVCVGDIRKAAEEIKSKAFKLAMVSIGDLSDVPFIGDYQQVPLESSALQVQKDDNSSQQQKSGLVDKLCNLKAAVQKILKKEGSHPIDKNAERKPFQIILYPTDTVPKVCEPRTGLGQVLPSKPAGENPPAPPAKTPESSDCKKATKKCSPPDISPQPAKRTEDKPKGHDVCAPGEGLGQAPSKPTCGIQPSQPAMTSESLDSKKATKKFSPPDISPQPAKRTEDKLKGHDVCAPGEGLGQAPSKPTCGIQPSQPAMTSESLDSKKATKKCSPPDISPHPAKRTEDKLKGHDVCAPGEGLGQAPSKPTCGIQPSQPAMTSESLDSKKATKKCSPPDISPQPAKRTEDKLKGHDVCAPGEGLGQAPSKPTCGIQPAQPAKTPESLDSKKATKKYNPPDMSPQPAKCTQDKPKSLDVCAPGQGLGQASS